MDFSQFNAAEQAHMSKVIEKKQVCGLSGCLSILMAWLIVTSRRQMQDFMRMYSSLVERCFNSCCNDFTSKALSTKEVRSFDVSHTPRAPLTRLVQEQCMLNCADKFLKHSERVGARFAEQNAGQCADWQVILVSKLTIVHRSHERSTKVISHLVKALDPVSYLCVIPSLPV